MNTLDLGPSLMEFIVHRINVGILVLDKAHRIVLWNRFMEIHSGRTSAEVVGQNFFECFPELPRAWLAKKIQSVFSLRSYAFTNWQQRAYLIRLAHNRPITGGVDSMRQDCTLLPIQSAKGTVEFVGITIADATDTALFEAQLREALHKIEVISTHDGLTGAFNRRKFDEELIREFSRARRYKAPLSLLLFDLDHFKKINDTYGHQAGDEVLRVVARIAGANLRKSDFFARYGGEEFVIILPSTPQNGCQQVGERLRQAIASTPISWENISINATISVGVTQMRPATENCQALLSEVDKALYASKSNGRNRVTCYRSEEIFYDI